jgi:hypothetical protein
MSFLDDLFSKRGQPSIGGLSFNFIPMLIPGSSQVPISFYEIDPLTSRTEHYYNARNNALYRRKFLSEYYAIWEQISFT